jgi:hypothetical protein
VEAVLCSLQGLFQGRGFDLFARLRNNRLVLSEPSGLFGALEFFEIERGVSTLVEAFSSGLAIEAASGGRSHFRIEARIDLPESAGGREQFKGMIVEHAAWDSLSFTQRYFRGPTLAQDPAGRFLEDRLQRCLRLVFGFPVRYRVSVSCLAPSKLEGFLRAATAEGLLIPLRDIPSGIKKRP